MKKRLPCVLLLVAAAAAAKPGLAAGPPMAEPRQTQDIRAQDAGVFLPSARLSVEMPRGGFDQAVLQAELSGGRGTDGQHIDAGAPVQFGRKTFTGPQDLRHDFQFQYAEASLSLRTYLRRFPSLGYEVGIGLAYASVDLRISSPTQTAHEDVNGAVYVVRGGASWAFLPRTRLIVSGSLLDGTAIGISDGGRADAHIAWTPWRHMGVRAGYSWWWLNSAREAQDRGIAKSPIHVQISGPSLSLELMF